ncbi:10003_t:CDS:2 [Entrophospora sp. SA101]|nr:10003_t:CDS:2 [Entrophospora sp. SA101]
MSTGATTKITTNHDDNSKSSAKATSDNSTTTPSSTSNTTNLQSSSTIKNGATGFVLTTPPTPQDYPSMTFTGRFTNGIAVIPSPIQELFLRLLKGINVLFVKKDLHGQAPYKLICIVIPVKSVSRLID